MMSKTILAEYDAENKTLKLEEPLEGAVDHERFGVVITKQDKRRPSWLDCEGTLSPEEGQAFTKGVEELFGPQE
jgi:hypothetical protein